ncbi:fimbria/pilus outer membrane usher protein [Pseudomonas sp. AU10]|uniref:fimbria/pilus outer membrane usher protein n=1 Tax=Pseudomonas sp. AU10 TaxID=882697 RepID=UPI0021E24A97|nr:fimbria/pilus outer membrane usher protein [Pseudomonas sp. AU10]MCV2226885.1 fimbrial biogenesis outer membrane usher protein [Pseudomonas sp. AU10]
MATAQAGEYFDPYAIELRDGQKSVDLTAFDAGRQLPGSYRVDILINGEQFESRTLEFVTAPDGVRLLPRLTVADLKAMGVRTEGFSTLSAMPDTAEVTDIGILIPNASTRFNFNQLSLNVRIPQAALKPRPRNAVDPALWDEGMPALMMNYSASGSNTQRDGITSTSNYLRFNTGLNLGAWRLRNNSTYTSSGGSSSSGASNGWENLDTYLQRDIHSLKSQLVLGDATTAGEVFDSVQFRGFQLYTDDNMLPDSLQGFAPVVRGIAQSDAQVTIRQNGYMIYQAQVAPGAFAITDLYPAASSGNLDVTIREADGSERTFVQPFSAVPIMQREGALKYVITGGQYRSYSSNDAKPDFVQSSVIYGLSNSLTLYTGTQLADNYRSLLIGTGLGLGDWGSISLDVTRADSTLQDNTTHKGNSFRAQYAKDIFQSGTTFTLAGYRYSTEGFYDFRETNEMLSGEDDQWRSLYKKRSKVSLQISQSLEDYGSLYVTALQQNYWGQSVKESTWMVGYNGSYNGITYGLTYSATQTPGINSDQQLAFNIQVPLGSASSSSTWARYQFNTDKSGRTSNEVGLSGTALAGNNLNYSASESYANQGQGNTGRASVDYRGGFGAVGASYSYGSDAQTLSYNLSGAVVAHPYGVTLSQSLGESSVLVRAPGASDVDLQNQSGVSTDPWGYAVVPYVSAYRKNRISLDPSSLSEDVDIETFTQTAIPTRGALVLADFETRVGGRALLSLTYLDKPVPFGATATLDAQGKPNASLVGGAGEVYLSGLPEQGQIQVKWGDAADQKCTASYTLPAQKADSKTSVRSLSSICQ